MKDTVNEKFYYIAIVIILGEIWHIFLKYSSTIC